MKVIVFGAGKKCYEYCQSASGDIEIVAIADNNFNNLQNYLLGYPVISPNEILNYDYDKVVIAINDCGKKNFNIIDEIIAQLVEIGVQKENITLVDFYECNTSYDFSRRVGFLHSLSSIIYENNVEGAVAECGVYRGHFAMHINKLFKDRKIYLFDTFEGFAESDIYIEKKMYINQYENPWISEETIDLIKLGSEEICLMRCEYSENIILRKGYVPDTFKGLENERFAFVSLDMDLYLPQLQALRFFAPRMSKGGIILLDDYYAPFTTGTEKAIDDFVTEFDATYIPIGDGCSVALVIN